GLVWTDSNVPMPATKVYLTIAGRYRIVELVGVGSVGNFILLLRCLVTARMCYTMSPVEVQTIYLTRRGLESQAPIFPLLELGMIDQIRSLVEHEPVLMNAVTGDDEDGWRIELRRELSLYRGN